MTEQERAEVTSVIAENIDALASIPNFVTAEPGFAIVDGALIKEPAVIVFVSRVLSPTELLEEERAPSQLGPVPRLGDAGGSPQATGGRP